MATVRRAAGDTALDVRLGRGGSPRLRRPRSRPLAVRGRRPGADRHPGRAHDAVAHRRPGGRHRPARWSPPSMSTGPWAATWTSWRASSTRKGRRSRRWAWCSAIGLGARLVGGALGRDAVRHRAHHPQGAAATGPGDFSLPGACRYGPDGRIPVAVEAETFQRLAVDVALDPRRYGRRRVPERGLSSLVVSRGLPQQLDEVVGGVACCGGDELRDRRSGPTISTGES